MPNRRIKLGNRKKIREKLKKIKEDEKASSGESTTTPAQTLSQLKKSIKRKNKQDKTPYIINLII